jgi:glutamate synthase domain-containing protein 3
MKEAVEYLKKLNKLPAFLQDKAEEILEKPFNNLFDSMKTRIFEQGKDANDGIAQASYSDFWAKVRSSRGLSTSTVDFTFSGKLKNSMKSLAVENGFSIVFEGNSQQEIASYHEKRNKKVIFSPSKDEIDVFAKELELTISEYIDNYLQ